MANLARQPISDTGTTLTFTAASAGGDKVKPVSGTAVVIRNGGGAGITATVVVPGVEYGQARPDIPVAVAAGADSYVHIPPELADTNGDVSITYSAVTSVTVAAVSF